jgi:hypothetical protein
MGKNKRAQSRRTNNPLRQKWATIYNENNRPKKHTQNNTPKEEKLKWKTQK